MKKFTMILCAVAIAAAVLAGLAAYRGVHPSPTIQAPGPIGKQEALPTSKEGNVLAAFREGGVVN